MAASPSLTQKTWVWDGSSRLAKSLAVPFGRTVARIEKRNGGAVHARDIVDEARPESSPIHGMFEWNNRVAGEHWREHQARKYLGALITVLPDEDGTKLPAYMCTGPSEGYTNTETILTNEAMTLHQIKMALRDAQAWRRRYENLKQFAGVFRELDRVEATVEPKAGARSLSA